MTAQFPSAFQAFSDEDKSEQKDKLNEMALMVAGLGIVSLIAFFFQVRHVLSTS